MSDLTVRLGEVIGPLRPEEERMAVDAAMAYVDKERVHVYGAELTIEKRRSELAARYISVLLADLDGYVAYEVIVGAEGDVVEARERPDLVPPFSDDEIGEAVALARADPHLTRLAERRGVERAIFYPAAHAAPKSLPRHRRVGIHYLDTSDPAAITPLVSIVVDITAREVESVDRRQEAN